MKMFISEKKVILLSWSTMNKASTETNTFRDILQGKVPFHAYMRHEPYPHI